MIRKTIFWIHLSCGVAAGLVILMMSATGVLLTYERQILDWADRDLRSTSPRGAASLPLEGLVAAVTRREPSFEVASITISADPAAPVSVGRGRDVRYVDRHSGEVLGAGAAGLREFFSAVTGWHRWFNVDGEGRAPWRAVTGASNLVFLFLILSGIYLWLPRTFKWAMFRIRILFNTKPASGQDRDFNWHHVLGIWSALPLVVVVASATVFYYPWANDLVYRSFGEEPPQRRGAAPTAAGVPTGGTLIGEPLPLDTLFTIAAAQLDSWRRITVQLPTDPESTVRFTLDQGSGGQPQLRHTLTLDAYTGKTTSWQPFTSQSAGQRARSYVRFLHTGEALGLIGQTIAGLVSLTSVFMVWTGLALAYRRLIVPVVRRAKRAR